nr:unnamed protein product [Callosobruchus analis]
MILILLLFQAERLADYGRLLSSSQPILNSRRRDLDRIQDLFPNDNLGLHLPEPSSTYSVKTKSFRKKSVGDLTALDNNNHHGQCNRIFLVEAPCVMSPRQLPLDAKPRHLFLFSDLLVVAKPRSGGAFKLKVSVYIQLIDTTTRNAPPIYPIVFLRALCRQSYLEII